MGSGISKKSKSKAAKSTQIISISPKIIKKASPWEIGSKYNIHNRLGSGAYSSVYLASNRSTQQFSALKIVKKSSLSSEMFDSNLNLKESAILSELDHPNIIKCYETFEDPNRFVVSEEAVNGGTLMDFFMSMNFMLTEDVIAYIMYQIFSGLSYCHDKGIVHRDIKLDNIFISSRTNLTIKIGDFGCSTKKGPTPLKGMRGTYIFMAPEIFENEYNEKVDIWSCGVILYILLTGKSPYKGYRKDLLIERIKSCPLKCTRQEIQELPSEILNLLEGLLKINPAERLSAKNAIKHPWIQKYVNASITDHVVLLDKLSSIPKMNALQKTMCMYISFFMPDNKVSSEIAKYFHIIDQDGNGTIDKIELTQELKLKYSEKEAKKIANDFFNMFDLNGNGKIDFSEFSIALSEKELSFSQKNIEKLFITVDIEKRGYITLKEIESFTGVKHDVLINDLQDEYKDNNPISLERFKKMLTDYTIL